MGVIRYEDGTVPEGVIKDKKKKRDRNMWTETETWNQQPSVKACLRQWAPDLRADICPPPIQAGLSLCSRRLN